MLRIIHSASAFLLILASQAWARISIPDIPIRFGPEFTFYSPYPESGAILTRIMQRQFDHLILGQPPGAEFKRVPRNRYISPNDWYFIMDTDPGVIEVQMKPMTWQEYDRYKIDIQDAVFTSAANEGSFPGLFAGGGHINIGLSEIVDASPLLLRNFLADLINHSELFMGVFGYDTNNALPFPLFSSQTQRQIIHSFDQFDRGEIDLLNLVKQIDSINYSQTDQFSDLWGRPLHRGKMVSLNLLHHCNLTGRLELRAVRPQASTEVWVNQIRLLQKRIMYLSKMTSPIPIRLKVPLISPIEISFEGQAHALNPPIDPQKALRAFHNYVTEAGERWEDHRSYLWPKWIADGEVTKYENSDSYRRLRAHRCAAQLEAAFI